MRFSLFTIITLVSVGLALPHVHHESRSEAAANAQDAGAPPPKVTRGEAATNACTVLPVKRGETATNAEEPTKPVIIARGKAVTNAEEPTKPVVIARGGAATNAEEPIKPILVARAEAATNAGTTPPPPVVIVRGEAATNAEEPTKPVIIARSEASWDAEARDLAKRLICIISARDETATNAETIPCSIAKREAVADALGELERRVICINPLNRRSEAATNADMCLSGKRSYGSDSWKL